MAGSVHSALSHDTFETTAIARLNATNVEVQVTLSQLGAYELVRQADPAGMQQTKWDFEVVRPKLTEQAGKMLEVWADSAPLPLIAAEVAAGEEGDVEFRFTYPSPSGQKLQLHTAFLTQLGRGYTCQLTLMDGAAGSIVLLKQRDKPVVEWAPKSLGESTFKSPVSVVPVVTNSPAGTVPTVDAAATISAGNPEKKTVAIAATTSRWLLVAAILGVVGVVFWRLRYKSA